MPPSAPGLQAANESANPRTSGIASRCGTTETIGHPELLQVVGARFGEQTVSGGRWEIAKHLDHGTGGEHPCGEMRGLARSFIDLLGSRRSSGNCLCRRSSSGLTTSTHSVLVCCVSPPPAPRTVDCRSAPFIHTPTATGSLRNSVILLFFSTASGEGWAGCSQRCLVRVGG